MTKGTEASEISEDDLETVSGGGLMDTPVGGWGKNGNAPNNMQSLSNIQNLVDVDIPKNATRRSSDDESFASTAGGSPNV